jgi:cytochrome c oxidase subunit 4
MSTLDHSVADHSADGDHTAHDAGHGVHPSERKYVVIAIFLAAITGIEVALYYTSLSQGVTNGLLLFFAAIKFSTVVMYFMHLKFDNRILTRLFVSGFILATFCYVTVLGMFGVLTGGMVVGAFALATALGVAVMASRYLLSKS